jgi:hypothetical protein
MNKLQILNSCPTDRFEVVSEPGAAIKITKMNLTDAERESLSINTRLSDLGQPAASLRDLQRVITAAEHALKSYEHGNSSPDLAVGILEEIVKLKPDA